MAIDFSPPKYGPKFFDWLVEAAHENRNTIEASGNTDLVKRSEEYTVKMLELDVEDPMWLYLAGKLQEMAHTVTHQTADYGVETISIRNGQNARDAAYLIAKNHADHHIATEANRIMWEIDNLRSGSDEWFMAIGTLKGLALACRS